MAVFFAVFKSDTLKIAFRRPKDAFRQKSVYKTPNACIMYEASVKIRKSVIIVDSYGNVIIDYNPDSPQWWITGFNSNYQNMNAGNLNMTFTIDFSSNPELYEAFIKSDTYLKHKGQWSTDPNNKYVLTFTWEGDQCIG